MANRLASGSQEGLIPHRSLTPVRPAEHPPQPAPPTSPRRVKSGASRSSDPAGLRELTGHLGRKRGAAARRRVRVATPPPPEEAKCAVIDTSLSAIRQAKLQRSDVAKPLPNLGGVGCLPGRLLTAANSGHGISQTPPRLPPSPEPAPSISSPAAVEGVRKQVLVVSRGSSPVTSDDDSDPEKTGRKFGYWKERVVRNAKETQGGHLTEKSPEKVGYSLTPNRTAHPAKESVLYPRLRQLYTDSGQLAKSWPADPSRSEAVGVAASLVKRRKSTCGPRINMVKEHTPTEYKGPRARKATRVQLACLKNENRKGHIPPLGRKVVPPSVSPPPMPFLPQPSGEEAPTTFTTQQGMGLQAGSAVLSWGSSYMEKPEPGERGTEEEEEPPGVPPTYTQATHLRLCHKLVSTGAERADGLRHPELFLLEYQRQFVWERDGEQPRPVANMLPLFPWEAANPGHHISVATKIRQAPAARVFDLQTETMDLPKKEQPADFDIKPTQRENVHEDMFLEDEEIFPRAPSELGVGGDSDYLENFQKQTEAGVQAQYSALGGSPKPQEGPEGAPAEALEEARDEVPSPAAEMAASFAPPDTPPPDLPQPLQPPPAIGLLDEAGGEAPHPDFEVAKQRTAQPALIAPRAKTPVSQVDRYSESKRAVDEMMSSQAASAQFDVDAQAPLQLLMAQQMTADRPANPLDRKTHLDPSP